MLLCGLSTAVNKPSLVKMGVVDTVLSLTATDVSAVIFKLLGVLRMLVDGQGTDKNDITLTLIALLHYPINGCVEII